MPITASARNPSVQTNSRVSLLATWSRHDSLDNVVQFGCLRKSWIQLQSAPSLTPIARPAGLLENAHFKVSQGAAEWRFHCDWTSFQASGSCRVKSKCLPKRLKL